MIVVPTEMGRLNVRTVLAQLQRVGTASRADLAKSLGMSQPTVGRIVDELLALDVLEEVAVRSAESVDGKDDVPSRLGRPGRLLRLDSTKARFLAIQLGVSGTSLASIPVGFNGEDVWTIKVSTPGSQRGSKGAQIWRDEMLAAVEKIPQGDFWGVLVSAPGIVDERLRRILYSPNLHWTEEADLPSLIGEIWDAPMILVQEERALALGHQSMEPAGEDFILVDFGEGVGGAVILEGKLYANPLPVSGELGHTPVPGNRRTCGCGAVGCMETMLSTRGLLQSFAENQSRGAPNTLLALGEHITDEGLPSWLTQALDAAAMAIAGALNVLGLRRVVITGSLADLPPCVVEYLSESIVRGALWARFGQVECQHSRRRRMAGLVAAGIDRLIIAQAGRNGQPDIFARNGHARKLARLGARGSRV